MNEKIADTAIPGHQAQIDLAENCELIRAIQSRRLFQIRRNGLELIGAYPHDDRQVEGQVDQNEDKMRVENIELQR